jgi:hypothetical protein
VHCGGRRDASHVGCAPGDGGTVDPGAEGLLWHAERPGQSNRLDRRNSEMVDYQHKLPVPVDKVTEALRTGDVSVTGVAYHAERHVYVPRPPPARPEDERSPQAFYRAVADGTPFFGLEQTEFVGNKWYVGFFRVGLDGPALCVYFDSTDAGLLIGPSESAPYYDVVLGIEAQDIFDALPKTDAPST